MKKELQDLSDEYLRTRDSLNEKEKALLERRIWRAASIDLKGEKVRARDWLGQLLNVGPNECELRLTLIALGDWVEPLWTRIIDSRLPLRTAVRLARKAKVRAATHSVRNTDALSVVLAEYDAMGPLAVNAAGTVYRRALPTTRVPKQLSESGELSFDVKDTKQFRAVVHTASEQYLEVKLSGVEPALKRELHTNFNFQLRAILEDLSRDVSRVAADQKKSDAADISWGKFRAACEVLGVVTEGRRVPNVADLKRRYRERAAKYHPDRNRSKDDMVKQYHAVNEAWETIKAFLRTDHGP